MSIDRKTLSLLWATSFGLCAYPGCNQELTCIETKDIIGNVCHIIAKNYRGPRGDISYTNEELDCFDNLILLCPTHHSIVDHDTDKYTVNVLKNMKVMHYMKMKERLHSGMPWSLNISQIYYLNIPRLASLPIKDNSILDMDILADKKCLHDMGFELNYILNKYMGVLNNLDICALSLQDCWENFNVGQIIAFDGKFRTKNVPGLDEYRASSFSLKGNLDKDPQLYLKQNNEKFILQIDPRWLATTTSFVNFKLGWIDVAGIAVVKYYDDEIIIATPYVIGIPKNDFWDMFLG